MSTWRLLGLRRGAIPKEEAVTIAQGAIATGPWAWAFNRRVDVARAWRTWVIHPAADDLPSGPWIYVDARDGRVLRVQRTGPAGRRMRLIAGAVVILMVALIVVLFAVSRVCNQQVLGSGRAVYGCRHLQATDPPMIAIGIVIVGALSVFYSEISGFGISLKRRVDEVSQTARAGLQLAEINLQATQRLDETTEDLADYNREATRRPDVAQPEPASEAQPDARLADVRRLAAQYNELRGTMPSSDQRTVLMDQIVQEMRYLLRGANGVDIAELLGSPDRGIRLAAYAYLLEHQDRELLSQLAKAAAEEDKPHVQYWALEALRHQLMATPQRLSNDGLVKLARAAQRLGPDSSRTRQINAILTRERSKR